MDKLRPLTYLVLVAMGLLTFLVPTYVIAADNPALNPIQRGACEAAGGVNCKDQATDTVNHTVSNLINILSIAVGLVAVIMIILAGLRYITSGGAAEKVSGAKSALLYAVIGLVIVALAQVIVHFVIQKVR